MDCIPHTYSDPKTKVNYWYILYKKKKKMTTPIRGNSNWHSCKSCCMPYSHVCVCCGHFGKCCHETQLYQHEWSSKFTPFILLLLFIEWDITNSLLNVYNSFQSLIFFIIIYSKHRARTSIREWRRRHLQKDSSSRNEFEIALYSTRCWRWLSNTLLFANYFALVRFIQ